MNNGENLKQNLRTVACHYSIKSTNELRERLERPDKYDVTELIEAELIKRGATKTYDNRWPFKMNFKVVAYLYSMMSTNELRGRLERSDKYDLYYDVPELLKAELIMRKASKA
jgi:hypothetical protein